MKGRRGEQSFPNQCRDSEFLVVTSLAWAGHLRVATKTSRSRQSLLAICRDIVSFVSR